jgi:hypothetical protein
MRCFPALERTRTPEKDISFKNIALILLSQGDADITVVSFRTVPDDDGTNLCSGPLKRISQGQQRQKEKWLRSPQSL